MKNVVVLAANNCLLSSVASPMDMFLQAGVLWNLMMGQEPAPEFGVRIATADGQPVVALNKIPIIPSCSMQEANDADLIIVPSQGFHFDPLSADHLERVEWLQTRYAEGASLASVCAGAFTLASTGLLDGKTATTHWGLEQRFRKTFPQVNLRTDLTVTDEGRLFCSGGVSAELNLSLYLIEKFCGRDVALQSSRCTLVDMTNGKQSPFAVYKPEKNHGDRNVLIAQNFMEKHLRSKIDVGALADAAKISLRQFNRRFKAATGQTVNSYLHLIRVEMAKVNLVKTRSPFEEISVNCGYENVSFFRRIFKKHTSLTPLEYRRQFGRR